ncbi:hypothetical protein [Aneurinibacillus migulanus]|uniref:hypothetical protein n=1 Tax=Aneurinibacillus migulanus TaxID=47500 RepID=UPI001F3F9F1B|nr:hypothetical protein [Aneurinibacillus migulanus]
MINRQILVVRDKKRRKGGGRERLEKDTSAFFCWSEGRIHPLLSHLSYFQPRYHVKILSVTYINNGNGTDPCLRIGSFYLKDSL